MPMQVVENWTSDISVLLNPHTLTKPQSRYHTAGFTQSWALTNIIQHLFPSVQGYSKKYLKHWAKKNSWGYNYVEKLNWNAENCISNILSCNSYLQLLKNQNVGSDSNKSNILTVILSIWVAKWDSCNT